MTFRKLIRPRLRRNALCSYSTAAMLESEVNVKVLALDLEGTLISNAVSQIPRPGLIEAERMIQELAMRQRGLGVGLRCGKHSGQMSVSFRFWILKPSCIKLNATLQTIGDTSGSPQKPMIDCPGYGAGS
jgi:hypothetical protein